jgi:leader peptidase (prepilin peptidase)/N-methyltransferase
LVSPLLLADVPPWFLRGVAVAFGLIWGSFLNVVIYRVPLEMSVVRPPSHCPGCGKPIAAYDNIPVLSYVILRGRARCCGTRMSPRYPLVELIGGALSLAIVERILLPTPWAPLGRSLVLYASDFTLAMALVAAAFIDAEHMYLPDPITIGGAILGFGTASLRGLSWRESFVGGVLGFVGVWLPFGVVYKWIRGRVGMGLGDAKLLMLAGAWFGWVGVVFSLVAGALQGTLTALVIYLVKGKIEEPEAVVRDREELRKAADEGDEEAKRAIEEDPLATEQAEGLGQSRLPFGPFLIMGLLELLLAGDPILAWYGRFLAR